MDNYSDAQMAVIVAGVVSAIRQIFPQIDGKGKVWSVALGISVLLCLLIALPSGATWQSVLIAIQRAIVVSAGAIGGASLVGYASGKVGASQ